MTYKEFLAKLRKTPRTWELLSHDIRCRSRCPIEVVFDLNIGDVGNDGRECVRGKRFRGDTFNKIVMAADGYGDQSIRADLLTACGLPLSARPDGETR